jgi:hypothetical protein
MSEIISVTDAVRIAAIPRTEIKVEERDLEELTRQLSCTTHSFKLKPLQALALLHTKRAGGLLGLLGCGAGKTLLSAVLPTFLNSQRPLLLVPAALLEKTHIEFAEWAKYFIVKNIKVLSYERLSRASGLEELKLYAPDLVVCDEAHNLKDISSARTLRIGAYLEAHPECVAVFLSGTLLNKSVHNIAHLSAWALGAASPFPLDLRTVAEWDELIYGDSNSYAEFRYAPVQRFAPNGSAREALFARLSTCAGVVLTDKDIVESGLTLVRVRCEVPQELRAKINHCIEQGVVDALADLPEIEEIMASEHLWASRDEFLMRALSQVFSGFLYFWQWPNNIPDERWLDTRRTWSRTARKILEYNLPGFDTLGLVERGFDSLPSDVKQYAEPAYHAWFTSGEYRKQPPPKRSVWVSTYLIDAVQSLLKKIAKPTLIWVNFKELGSQLSERLNIPYIEGGMEVPAYEGQSLILSIKSHGTGKNLQAWANNIVAAPLSDPAAWEQLIARTHRQGQLADEVTVYCFNHALFGAALNRARFMSKAVGDCTGKQQRLNYATVITL